MENIDKGHTSKKHPPRGKFHHFKTGLFPQETMSIIAKAFSFEFFTKYYIYKITLRKPTNV